MSHPFCIDNFKQENSFDFSHKFLAVGLFFFAVNFLCLVIKLLDDVVTGNLFKFLFIILKVISRSQLVRHEVVRKSCKIPVFFIFLVITDKILVNCCLYNFIEHLEDRIVEVFAVKYLVTLFVNDFSHTVHNVIVIKNVLSGTEVSAFDFLL